MSVAARSAAESRSVLTLTVLPQDLNQYGSLFGGQLLAWVDRVANICAMRHCHCNAVTVALESMSFECPVRQGDILMLTAELVSVGRSSMKAVVTVVREDPTTGDQKRVCAPHLTFVALDRDGKPSPVPPLPAAPAA
jgi:acyl-CoA hydrolase